MPSTKPKVSNRTTHSVAPSQADEILDFDPSRPLSRKGDELFVQAYLGNGLNATKAYLAAHPRAKSATAEVEGSRTLGKPKVSARVSYLANARAKKFEVDGDDLLRHAKAVALADHRELVQFVYRCCRYCHGVDQKFQRTISELERDREEHRKSELKREALAALKNKDFRATEFDEMGGGGFNEWADPAQHCPNCHGHGVGRVEIADTRKLSADAAMLFAGVEETKDGLKVRMHDKGKALDMLFRYRGLYEADNAQLAAATSQDALAALDAAMKAARDRQVAVIEARKRVGFLGD